MHEGGIIVNIKAATKYQLIDYIKSIKTYYFVILLVIIFFTLLDKVWGGGGDGSYNGFEVTTSIFLFVCGLNSFKTTFLMMMQNGISRKSMFISNAISILTASFLMAVLDRIMLLLVNTIGNTLGGLSYSGLFDAAYGYRLDSLNSFVFQLELILLTWMVYTVATVAGYFITTLYYRMNTALKVIVSVGVPASILFIIPMLDSMVFKGNISTLLNKIFSFIFGVPGGGAKPYNLILLCVLGSIIALGLSWLLVKRAVDKN